MEFRHHNDFSQHYVYEGVQNSSTMECAYQQNLQADNLEGAILVGFRHHNILLKIVRNVYIYIDAFGMTQ